jgi:transketolase
MDFEELRHNAAAARLRAFETLHATGGGHYGGVLSEIEILTVAYGSILRIDAKDPEWPDRDYFLLSKGHGAVGMAAVLTQLGLIDADYLGSYKAFGSSLGWHTTKKMPWIEHPTGSLGHGLSVAVGIALGKRLDRRESRVFVLLGDGECDEGSVWEAAMSASKYGLDSLIAIVDRNFHNLDARTEELMPLEPFEDKWRAFGWTVATADGHDVQDLCGRLSGIPLEPGKPSVLIARTVKGKGVSFMEDVSEWHSNKTTTEQYAIGVKELKQRLRGV